MQVLHPTILIFPSPVGGSRATLVHISAWWTHDVLLRNERALKRGRHPKMVRAMGSGLLLGCVGVVWVCLDDLSPGRGAEGSTASREQERLASLVVTRGKTIPNFTLSSRGRSSGPPWDPGNNIQRRAVFLGWKTKRNRDPTLKKVQKS